MQTDPANTHSDTPSKSSPSPLSEAVSPFRFEAAVRSLCSPTGQGRSENQDNYLVINGQGQARFLQGETETCIEISNWPAGHWRVAILDGMGGHSHGREAAEKSIDGLLNIPATHDLATLSEAVNALHMRLHHQFRSVGLDSGCTLVLLEIPPDAPTLLFHVGDSRLYAISQQNIQYLTIDHVPATHMAMLGLLDGAEWIRQVHALPGSQISQAFVLGSTLGTAQPFQGGITPELFELHDGNIPLFLQGLNDRRQITLESDTIYLLATDGLWNLRQPQTFIRRWPELLIQQPQCTLEELLDMLLAELAETIQQQRSQPDDNCTVAMIRKFGLPPEPPATAETS